MSASMSDVAVSDVAVSDVAVSDVAVSDVAVSDVAVSGGAVSDVALPEVDELDLAALTRSEIEDYLYREAELLDSWDLDGWFALFADTLRYVVPCNDTPGGDPAHDLVLIDDDELRLRLRVERLNSRKAHREYPHSRTNHQIYNVRLRPVDEDGALPVQAAFTVWRFRNGRAVSYVGQHYYRLVVQDGQLRIRSKRAVLDMTELRPAGDLAIIL